MIATRKSDDVIRFIEGMLTLSGDYRGKPFILRDWQKQIIRKLFDTVKPDGTRQYKDCGIWLPRKNAKTELATALAAYFFFCVKEEGEIYSAAAEREQAGIIFRKLAGMIRRSPELESRCKIIDSQKRIVHKTSGSIFWSLSAEDGSKHGYNPSLVIGDEIHCWKKRDLWTALVTGSDVRAEPLFISITTAGVWEPESLECELYEYAKKVQTGSVEDPSYLPIIYEADKDADWLDEKVWHEVNPALGDFRSLDAMRQLAHRAQHNTRLENDFRRLYLNQHTQQTTRFLSMEKWNACETDGDIEPGSAVFGGLDLASTTDIAAFCLAQKTEAGYRLRWRFWIPQDRMVEIERADRVPYSQWVREGLVTATPGGTVDYSVIVSDILEDAERYRLQMIGFDPWNATATSQQLEVEGLTLVQMQQGVKVMSEPSKELERCVLNGSLDHGGNKVAKWMAGNIEIWSDGNGNIKPIRPKHGASSRKIDGLVAAVMAIKLASTQEPEATADFGSMGALWD